MNSDKEPSAWLLEALLKNPETLALNLARLQEEAAKALAAWLKPREEGSRRADLSEELTLVFKVLGKVSEYWLSDPLRAAEAQRRLQFGLFGLWTNVTARMIGANPPAVAAADSRDKRFKDAEWSDNPIFDSLRQAYLVVSRWAESLVEDAVLDPETKHKAEFYLRQITAALSPSNFLATNPEIVRATLSSSAANLARGARMLAEDIAAGHGELRLRQSDPGDFELGRDIAATPGKVIHQNAICQLIQYEAATETVFKRPLLLVPPWINKFYVLDLTPDKSLIAWAVAQGHTVFVISWVNPDASHAAMDWEDYMRLGILESLDVITAVTGEKKVNVGGYCVGGTLLAVTLAYLAATGDDRIASATLLATQVDFTFAGDLKVFADEDQIRLVEERMRKRGYLEGTDMALAFNMLRPKDLIWQNVVSTYFLGKEPAPFDLLYWNADATRMPAANHSFYLRKCYLTNAIARGEVQISGVPINVSRVKVPIYNLAAADDHIAPAKSVYLGGKLFGGPVTFVLAGSGHIAGVMNGPARGKYQFWTDGNDDAKTLADWQVVAEEHPGSWWPHWHAWMTALDSRRTNAKRARGKKASVIEDAPGSYVRVRT